MLLGNQRGLRNIRKILENNVKKQMFRLNNTHIKFLNNHKLDVNNNYTKEFITAWGESKLQSQLAKFIYLLCNNRLRVNSRVHNYKDISPQCTFCELNYTRI